MVSGCQKRKSNWNGVIHWIILLLAVTPFSGYGSDYISAGQEVALYASRNTTERPLTSVPSGTRLRVEERSNDGWLRIKAPEAVRVWVWSELVRDGKAVAAGNVRSDHSIHAAVVGSVSAGEEVTSFRRAGDWSQISAPQNCHLWVRLDAIGAGPATMQANAGAVERAPVREVAIESAPPPAVKETADHPLLQVQPGASRLPLKSPSPGLFDHRPSPVVTLHNKSTDVTEGILRPAGLVWPWNVHYRLITMDKRGRPLTLCYVTSSRELSGHVGRHVSIEGRRRQPLGLRYPVIAAQRVVLQD